MRQFGFRIDEAEVAPGTLGLLYDSTPELTTADVRPFVWAIALFRKAVRRSEVIGCLTMVCAHSELYSGFSDELDSEDNRTRLEWLVDEVLGDMTASGLLQYDEEDDIWVLNASDKFLPDVIKAVAGVNGSLPAHYIYQRALRG
jgi:hypothetical protein